MNSVVIACRDMQKVYRGPQDVAVLLGIDLEIRAGERIAITGRSGSGKSTLLHLLGGLDTPTSGTVAVQGRSLSEIGEAERGRLRNETLGFVYQFHHLLPEFTAVENVAMPLLIRRTDKQLAVERAKKVLAEVGLARLVVEANHRLEHLVRRVRVEVAGGLVGNLDSHTADEV
ncbi:MAG TPA: ATP-binding cassette domain-containing protein, partial [Burkholderiales bacterium]|nr:ATP-binding cassette domain-containing protein [Burkholderiales bacterium]